MSQWQPIETAPLEQRVLVTRRGQTWVAIATLRYSMAGLPYWTDEIGLLLHHLTHWAPWNPPTQGGQP